VKKKTPRPRPLTGAGRGIEAGAHRFRGPGGPVTNTRRQLRKGIKDVSVASKLRKSLPSVERIFIVLIALAIFYSTADYSTTAGPILILFAGGCWARCQLPNGIR